MEYKKIHGISKTDIHIDFYIKNKTYIIQDYYLLWIRVLK